MYTERYFKVFNGKYDISCKAYIPVDWQVEGVVLGVHGYAGSKESSTLRALADKVSRSHYAVLTFDFPGHGDSPVGIDEFCVENCMRDLRYVADLCLKQLPNAEHMIFATSFGGFVTLLLGDELRDFKRVLRSPAINLPEKDWGTELPDRLKATLPAYTLDWRDCNREIMIIQGDRDEVVPVEKIKDFCYVNSLIELKVIAGASHRYDNPGDIEQVVEAACEFWSGQ